MGINKQESISVNRRDFLQKLSTIVAGGIFANLTLPTDAMGPTMELSEEQRKQEQDRRLKKIEFEQLNSSIPCDDRKALRQYMKDHNYIREYTRHQRIQELPLDKHHQGQLNLLLQPIIQDRTNSNDAVYTLLHHLMLKQMRTHSQALITKPAHHQLITQLEGALPHGDKPYTYRYVDPSIIDLIDDVNTKSLLTLTHAHYEGSHHTPEYHPDTIEPVADIYEVDGIKKYSHNYAKKLLKQHHIGLRSSSMGTKETGNNRSSNRSSLAGINASSVDGVINLIEDVRQRWNYRQTEHITGGTELGIHRAGPDGHEGGRKIDLGESLLVLIILLEQTITKTGIPHTPIIIGNYEYTFDYHGPDRHLDMRIKKIDTEPVSITPSIPPPTKSGWKIIKIPRDRRRPKAGGPTA